MSFEVGAFRLLNYSQPVAPAPQPAAPLADIRQDAKALKKQLRQQAQAKPQAKKKPAAPPPLFSLPGLANLLSNFWNWLAPPTPSPQPPTGSPQNPAPEPKPSGKATQFKLSSFNILGSSHTVGGKGGYAPGVVRIREAADLIRQKGVDVVGFQEMNNDQAQVFKQDAGDTFGLFPGNVKRHLGSHNSIAWRKDTWDLVKAEIVEFPSHLGRKQPTPVVLLKNKKTGQKAYFINVHNAPGYHKGGAQQQWRDKAVTQQVALINKLQRESGLPVIVTGDMNEKETVFRRMKQEAGMHAANEGPNGRMPKYMNIDWIFGSKDVEFSKFQRDPSSVRQKISDHGMLVSNVRID